MLGRFLPWWPQDSDTKQLKHKLAQLNIENHRHRTASDSAVSGTQPHTNLFNHERRVQHHALQFWQNPFELHPSAVLKDEHISQHKCIEADRIAAEQHCI